MADHRTIGPKRSFANHKLTNLLSKKHSLYGHRNEHKLETLLCSRWHRRCKLVVTISSNSATGCDVSVSIFIKKGMINCKT